eukprot:gnl/Dysnectes_brevis/2582_a3113_536.p1 GENE.gnl/Dysnectes_brevis/2582_a3113_536~~gnl/Dysnectes_brevis/2582_a3113_536.p1  ORF type:complete len:401 (-),score=147.02 gnl/Dysnectes_brevis/2582_a3113_536:1208-2410(-)
MSQQKTKPSESYLKVCRKRREIHSPFDFDQYYSLFEVEDGEPEITIPSVNFPLSRATGEAILRWTRARYLKDAPISRADFKILLALEKDIQAHCKQWCDGFFIRLSSRSPKDATDTHYCSDLFAELASSLPQELRDWAPGQPITDQQANRVLIEISRAQHAMLCCPHATAAMASLLSSERVRCDLLESAYAADAGMPWDVKVILRPWWPVQDSLEFRCWAVRDEASRAWRLTAVSQYNHYALFTHWERHQPPALLAAIQREFIGRVAPRLAGLASDGAVVDFAMIPAGDGYRPVVLELNPLESTTGCCLYIWRLHEQFLRGLGPFPEESEDLQRITHTVWLEQDGHRVPIRVRSEPAPNIRDFVEHVWGCVRGAEYGRGEGWRGKRPSREIMERGHCSLF